MIGSPKFESKFDRSVEIDHSDPNLLVNFVTDVLIDAAEKVKVKHRRYNSNNDPPWFDKSCRELKNSIKILGAMIRKNTTNKSWKSELYAKKKELKKLVKANKCIYKNDLMDLLNHTRNDSKKFWKLLDGMEKKKDDSVFKQGISNQR